MKKENGFYRALLRVISYPVYLVFAVILIIYAVAGNWAESLLFLAAVIVSVSLKAYFLFCTEKSSRKGTVPDKKGTKKGRWHSFAFVSDIFSAVCAFSCIPLLVSGILNPPENGLSGILFTVLSFMCCGLAVLSGSRGSVLSYVSSTAMAAVFPGIPECGYSGTDAVEKIAEADTVLIMCPDLVYDKRPAVRSIYYSGTHYRGMSLSESGLRFPAECAFYVFSCIIAGSEDQPELKSENNDAVIAFARMQNADRQGFYSKICYNEIKTDFPGRRDVTLFAVFGGSRKGESCFVRSSALSSLDRCAFMRMHDGTSRVLNDRDVSDISLAYEDIRKKGLTPYIIYSSDDVSADRHEIHRGVFETMIGVGGVFPESNPEVCTSLEQFGIRPVLVLPSEKKAAFNFTVSGGLADGPDGCATLGEFISAPENIQALTESRNAFLGFDGPNAVSLARRLRKSGSRILAVLRRSSDFALINESVASCAVKDASDAECMSICDSAVPAAGESEAYGLNGVFNLITSSVAALCKVSLAGNIMLAYTVLQFSVLLISLFSGADGIMPSASALLLTSAFSAFCAAFSVTADKLYVQNRDTADVSQRTEKKRRLEYSGLGLLTAVGVCAVGMLAFADNTASCRAFIFCSLILCGISVSESERLFSGAAYGRSGLNLQALICVTSAVLICLVSSFFVFPRLTENILGISSDPVRVLLYSFIPACIPPLYLAVALLIKKATEPNKLF